MRLKRMGVMSMAMTFGVMYAVFGLIFGAFFALFSLVGGGLMSRASDESSGAGAMGLLFGTGAVIILPIFYGVLGFIGGALTGALYNLVAKVTGGIELALE